jgi:beta-glucanase (GH16 family)
MNWIIDWFARVREQFAAVATVGLAALTIASAVTCDEHKPHGPGPDSVRPTDTRPDPGGVALPAAQRPTEARSVVFADEFTGAAGSAPDGALWQAKLTDEWQPTRELQTYTADRANAQLDGAGSLAITAHADGDGWTSARLHSRAWFTPGVRIEARLALPTGAGAWGAFWLLGDDSVSGWPACGEIDVVELPAAEGGRAYAGTHQTGVGGHVGSGELIAPLHLADPAGWHTYAVEWRPGSLAFYTDGVHRGTITRAAIEALGGVWLFDDRPQRVILNLAIGGWGGTPGPWTSQVMRVDYVRATVLRV